MGLLNTLIHIPGHVVDSVGSSLGLPELGISEKLGVHQGANIVSNDGKLVPTSWNPQQVASGNDASAGGGGSSYGGGGGTGYTADDIAYLADQGNMLRALLGRVDTSVNQGIQRNEDEYNRNADAATRQKEGLVTDENTAKQNAFDTINRNANIGYRSLAQIIGRAAGTGSSAFQEALPDVVGKDTSSKRQNATVTHDTNLSKIDQNFGDVIADLLRQKKDNEGNIRSQGESQKQNILGQIAQNEGQVAQAKGGGYAAVKAAQAPTQAAIEASRNAVDNIFNTFRTPFTPKALAPDTAAYSTDRSVVNAQSGPQGAEDPANPYASLLKKRLTGVA